MIMEQSKILYEKGLLKNKEMLTQSQLDGTVFAAKLDNIKLFHSVLKSIHFHDDVNIRITNEGFRATVEDAKYIQASLYVAQNCFLEFNLETDDDLLMRVNLNVICDCLSIFSSVSSSLQMLYKGHGAPLVLLLENHGCDDLITECSIKTKYTSEPVDFSLDENDPGYNFVMIRGPDFANLVNEIHKSADELEIFMSPNAPYFQLTVLGVMQAESNFKINNSSEMMIKFDCKSTTSVKYKMSHVRIATKALNLASKVAIRTDSTGLLGLQIMIPSQTSAPIYIEYFLLPLVDEI